MKRTLLLILSTCMLLASNAQAFCGFYVAKADTKLFNKASKIVLVRDGEKTVLTMSNDYQGEMKEFAIVIPVPTFIQKDQIHVASAALIEHLDAYSAPRLVEYFDEDPCQIRVMEALSMRSAPAGGVGGAARTKSLGVTIEAEYTVGEYDIVILSAEQSSGLETWLIESGYKIPPGASDVLGSYIKQNMKFFVAKVNLEEQSKLGFSFLRPIQIAFNSPKFMLPIRLGMVNADGTQDLFVFALTRKGRVETTNYRTVKLPEGMDVPLYVKEEFPDFYKAMFTHQVEKEDRNAVFTEYAWDMGWCDPCSSEPLSNSELKELGVFWIDTPVPVPMPMTRPGMMPVPGPQNAFITRLHVRYDNDHFPEDLTFQETSDRTNFQGRYVLRHPWSGTATCAAAEEYQKNLPKKYESEAQNLASLTGWEVADIRQKMQLAGDPPAPGDENWWKNLWR